MFKNTFVIFIFSILFISTSYSKDISLHIATIEDSPNLHLFFHELLKTSLTEDGHNVKLITKKFPHSRLKYFFDKGKLSIHWLLQ